MQTDSHKKFWKDFFSASSAAKTGILDWNFANPDGLLGSSGEINLQVPEDKLGLLRANQADKVAYPYKDVILVLDNSGSMRQNDPGFLLKKAVTEFIKMQNSADRISIIVFDEKVKLGLSLENSSLKSHDFIISKLAHINYQGQLTDSPGAIERAIYELKTHGRPKAGKIIVFMTDGIIDTGAPERDKDRGDWLENSLTSEAEESGIRIFGIAFSSLADYQLIQSITQKTSGEYYRALKAEDIEKILASINKTISQTISVSDR